MATCSCHRTVRRLFILDNHLEDRPALERWETDCPRGRSSRRFRGAALASLIEEIKTDGKAQIHIRLARNRIEYFRNASRVYPFVRLIHVNRIV